MNLSERFTFPLLAWFDDHGRKDLPWQHPRSPYRVWISEIMLQQTQVKTVIPYFNRFMASFPDIWHLARASEDAVLAHWSGLGYYSRARNLIKTANIICQAYHGAFPEQVEALTALPGIGPSTAAAITSQAFNQSTPILDANVTRVLCRYFQVEGFPNESATKKRLWQLATQCMSSRRCADYTQAIMDLGATCCTNKNPRCHACPLTNTCQAFASQKILEYPKKKIKTPLPIKQQQFLLLYDNENKIYLEKRPPVGLWGGLWCLPSTEINLSPESFIKKNYGLASIKKEELLTFKHTFSHFHLLLTVIALHTKLLTCQVAESQGKWFTQAELHLIGLAKPISKILNYFFSIR